MRIFLPLFKNRLTIFCPTTIDDNNFIWRNRLFFNNRFLNVPLIIVPRLYVQMKTSTFQFSVIKESSKVIFSHFFNIKIIPNVTSSTFSYFLSCIFCRLLSLSTALISSCVLLVETFQD